VQFLSQRIVGTQKFLLEHEDKDRQLIYARKSYRQFDSSTSLTESELNQLFQSSPEKIVNPKPSLAALLSVCAAARSSEHFLPKYLYASAGSAYPVKLYLHVGKQTGDLGPGIYFYHAVEHALYLIQSQVDKDVCGEGMSIIAVDHSQLIEPLYGSRSMAFSAYEHGAIDYLLSQAALNMGWRLENAHTVNETAISALLRLKETDRVLLVSKINEHDVKPENAPAQPEPSLGVYVYIQKNSVLKPGLYSVDKGSINPCNLLSPYPLCLDHQGDNADVLADAAAVIFLTSKSNQTQNVYQHFGSMAQRWMMNANAQKLGLCTLGLPIVPDQLAQAMSGDVHMAFALGHVSFAQQAQKTVSVVRPAAISLEKYLKDELIRMQTLPSYMIPSDYLAIDAFPLSSNAKVDNAALAKMYQKKTPTSNRPENAPGMQSVPMNSEVKRILEIIERQLGISIDPTRTWAANQIRSVNAPKIIAALEEYGLY
jgi:hypothetical protein